MRLSGRILKELSLAFSGRSRLLLDLLELGLHCEERELPEAWLGEAAVPGHTQKKDRSGGVVQNDCASVKKGQIFQPSMEDRAMEIDCMLTEGREQLGESTHAGTPSVVRMVSVERRTKTVVPSRMM